MDHVTANENFFSKLWLFSLIIMTLKTKMTNEQWSLFSEKFWQITSWSKITCMGPRMIEKCSKKFFRNFFVTLWHFYAKTDNLFFGAIGAHLVSDWSWDLKISIGVSFVFLRLVFMKISHIFMFLKGSTVLWRISLVRAVGDS